ncbi:hypothetical protein H7B90_03485 [Cohnella xylanilytica]|uniref:Uncharacterized protein n=1 Tax=Cohnella xylanilytica TaxID=557555 RepID=A0A841TQ55_9BACL|nr:hypothetical protein [Cohnella xylanilytica]MBB6690457.1 hypothetical protein [Cohnella xylanilytica]
MAIFLWLIFTAISCFVLYLIVRTAIDHASISSLNEDFRSLQHQMNRHHQEMMKQMEMLRQAITDSNKGNNVDKSV